MEDVLNQVDASFKYFYEDIQRFKLSDMICRDCGKLIVPQDTLLSFRYVAYSKFGKQIAPRVIDVRTGNNNAVVEHNDLTWMLYGKQINDKTYVRHLCWNCLMKKIPYAIQHNKELNLIDDRNMKKWDRRLRKGTWKSYVKLPPPRSNSPVWWFQLIFDVSREDLDIARTKQDSQSFIYFVRRFGEEEGKKKFEENQKVQARNGNSLEYFITKFGEEEGQKKYDELCKSKGVSKENCIKKYGKDAGLKFYKHYCDRQAYAGNKIEYFIEKYGEEEGRQKYDNVCHRKALTLTNMIAKYGIEEGTRRYEDYVKNSARKSYSEVSQIMFEVLDNALGNDFSKDSKWQLKNFEAEVEYMDERTGRMCFFKPDYLLGNKIIEFFGDYWHANPQIYAKDTMFKCITNKQHMNGMTAAQIWKSDKWRANKLKSMGYDVHIVWENDWHDNPDMIIDTCCKFLRGEAT